MKLRTCSSIVLEYLKNNIKKDDEFSSIELLNILQKPSNPQVTQSAVTSFLTVLTREGAIKVIGDGISPNSGRKVNLYKIVNLSHFTTKEYHREIKETKVEPRTVDNTITAKELTDLVYKLNNIKTSLADYSIDDLLNEIRRRVIF